MIKFQYIIITLFSVFVSKCEHNNVYYKQHDFNTDSVQIGEASTNNIKDWSLGDVSAPNGILDFFYDNLSEPSNIDDLITFMEYESTTDSSSKWFFHYSLEYLKNNYDCLKMEKNKSNNIVVVTIKNDGEIVAEEGCDYQTIPPKYLLKPVIIDNSYQRIFNDSIKISISSSLIDLIKRRKAWLERNKLHSQKIIKVKIIFEFKNNTLFNLISGEPLDINNNTYYEEVYNYFDSLSMQNKWNRIAVIFWDLICI